MRNNLFEKKTSEVKYRWDEENRLLGVDENGFVSHYLYDANGARTLKVLFENEGRYINAMPDTIRFSTDMSAVTLYISPYFIANDNQKFTKHIYIGGERIVSQICDPQNYGSRPTNETPAFNTLFTSYYTAKRDSIESCIESNYRYFGVPYAGGYDMEPEEVLSIGGGDIGDFPQSVEETQRYFYNKDHLGSSTYITDKDGNIVQHLEYLPYGEVFIDKSFNDDYTTPYKFNGKELDEETGLYYYGARYLHPKYAMWLSTDPLEGKSPDVSSYCYTMGNPIRLIDPIGTDTLDITFANGKWSYSTPIIAKGNDIFRIHKDNRIGIATFEGGNSLNLLNLFVGDDKNYTLGIYHISDSSEIGSTGFYVAPGGKASIVEESKRRIPDGTYPMTTPEGWEQWRQPGIGGSVKDRGIRFHFGYPHPLNWTEGCFILSSDYSVVNNNIEYNKEESRSQVRAFDFALGASKVYDYRVKGKKYMRIGASFSNPINRIVHIKSLKQNWQK